MGTIWIKDIKGGLDTRRMPETLTGGAAILAQDGHVNRGGEFEQRAAFVDTYDLPAGLTVSLGANATGIYVFGSGAAPVMPRGVTYQQLAHPDGVTPIVRVISSDLFQSKIYAVAEYSDGSIHHFYDGTLVTDWQDGRARMSFSVVGGGPQPGVPAAGTFTVSGGTASALNTIADIKLNSVSILGVPVQHTGDNSITAANVAAQINAFVSTPDYSASAVGPAVTISAVATGTAANGLTPAFTLTGDVAISSVTTLAGGSAVTFSQLADLQVNNVSILNGPVDWTTDDATTAAAIADSINLYASTPDYTATVIGSQVNVLAASPGTAPNGFSASFTPLRGLVLSPASGTLAGGLAPGVVFQSGTFAKTFGSKVYVTSGPDLNFSGVMVPTGFQSLNVGAGFIDMSTQAAGSETLQAVGKYLTYMAVFAERVVQIWYMDPDPKLNTIEQILLNIGTLSPRSVVQFGDQDLFFLDESGVRSIRSRYASVSAATDDIGIPVDTLIGPKIRAMTTVQRSRIIGLIEPTDGRFWLVFPDQIFVLSFFKGSEVSAWSTYTPSVNNVPFTIDDARVLNKKVYVRSGDTIYVYGGIGNELVYDTTSPELWLPYNDAENPSVTKQFKTIDVACQGAWQVSAGCEPTDLGASDNIATVNGTTYTGDSIPFEVEATHVSLRFKGVGVAGAKRIAAATMTYEPIAP